MKSAELKDRPRGTGHLPSAEHGKLFDSQIMYAVGLEVKIDLAEGDSGSSQGLFMGR